MYFWTSSLFIKKVYVCEEHDLVNETLTFALMHVDQGLEWKSLTSLLWKCYVRQNTIDTKATKGSCAQQDLFSAISWEVLFQGNHMPYSKVSEFPYSSEKISIKMIYD